MWLTLAVMALAVSLEPFRIGVTVLLLNRPRPLRLLSVFLCGGFAMGTTVGLVVLFVLRPVLLGSHTFVLPTVQIVIGALALLVAAWLATGVRLGRSDTVGRLSIWARRLTEGRSLWVAGLAGLGMALPSVDYLAALAVIVASGASVTTQIGAVVAFNVVALGLVEIALIAYVVAPERTRTSLRALNQWLRSRRRREVAALLAVVGAVLLGAGLLGV